jgi:hypothetical protein
MLKQGRNNGVKSNPLLNDKKTRRFAIDKARQDRWLDYIMGSHFWHAIPLRPQPSSAGPLNSPIRRRLAFKFTATTIR